eukprot:4313512-Pyramimonas_sp.AAC.1
MDQVGVALHEAPADTLQGEDQSADGVLDLPPGKPLLGERQAPGKAGAGCRLRQQRGPDHLDVGHERGPGDDGQRVPLPAT